MALISWSNTLSVEVQEIDQQHQKLIRLINKLNDAMLQRRAKEELGNIIQELLQYTISHFALEEKYFDKYGYPDAAAHKTEHTRFVAQAQKFRAELEDGKMGLSIEIMSFLSDWLRNHIMVVDKKYTAFFHEKGVK
jgi:hemerythrin